MVFLKDESLLAQTHQIISELATYHPCRAVLMAGDRTAPKRDIEMYVSAHYSSEKQAESSSLCCEEITLTARGEFVSELPSAAVPLLVPDLPVFLWWRNEAGAEEKVFGQLCQAADRLIIDSADSPDPAVHIDAVARKLKLARDEEIVLSDINWARLIPWRASLANFYDVQGCHAALDQIDQVRIDFTGEPETSSLVAAQGLLIAGWLASRLNWKLADKTQTPASQGKTYNFSKDDHSVVVSFNVVHRPAMKSGRLTQIELQNSKLKAVFGVSRSEDGTHLETWTQMGEQSYPSRSFPNRNMSDAQLLSREMEMLRDDEVYEEAIAAAMEMVRPR
jgi:glucose-6-phosphate dehydrogenase assembly protein OpcA